MAIGASIAPTRRLLGTDAVRLLLSAMLVGFLGLALAYVVHRSVTASDGTDVAGPGGPFAAGGVAVEPASGVATATALRAGDRVVGMFGRSVDDWAAHLLDTTAVRPTIAAGDEIEYAVDRGGRVVTVRVGAGPFDTLRALERDWGVLVLALSMQLVGIYLFGRRPAEPAARALLVAGTGMFASTVPWAIGLQATDLARPAGFWLYALAAGVAYTLFWSGVLHLALVFPTTHRFATGRGRVLALAYGLPFGGQFLLILGAALASGSAISALAAWITGQAILQVSVLVATLGLLAYGYLRFADPLARAQLRWMAAAVVVAGVSGLLLWFGPVLVAGSPLVPPSAVALLGLPFPVALTIAIDRHHLFDLDRVLNRSLVYGGLTAGVILTYAATVAAIGGLIPGNTPFAVALLGAGAVAVVALPLHQRLQGAVDRLMYGDRDEPDSALRRLGRRLEASVEPKTVLPILVDAVAEALRAPYVAIEFERDGIGRIEAAHGSLPVDPSGPRETIRVAIPYGGLVVGTLLVAARAPTEPFSSADRALLADLARQAAPTVEALRLTADLRRSRDALVAAREEERRRLRRDLHDELGPALAATVMKAGAARHLMASDPARASTLLDGLETDARAMVEDIRRIARDLRPPALDELGLLGVLRERIAGFDDPIGSDRPIRVSLDAPDAFPVLPAAVEVAALRIALEGLTNAARHGQASAIRVGLRIDGDVLVVSVDDDGIGIPADAPSGVGLASMRERADELGGTLSVEAADGGGTRLTARLPLAPASPT